MLLLSTYRADELAPSGGASTNGWYGSSVPTRSRQRPTSVSNPAARACAASSLTSRVLPIPASPATSTVDPPPDWARRSARSRRSSSSARPTSGAPLGAGASRSASSDREQAPFAGDAGKRPAPAVGELEPGAGDEVADGLRHEHLAGRGLSGDAGGDLHREAADAVPLELDLAGVHPGADADAERPERADDRAGAADGARRAVEGGEDPIAGSLDLAAAEPGQLGVRRLAIARGADDLVTSSVTRRDRRRQGSARRAALGQERLDGVEDLIGIDADEVVGAGQLDETRAGMRSAM